MVIAGYIASIFIGVSLGLVGSGGSILTVPVLVYLFSLDTALATVYSLFIVGSTSVVGSFSYFKKGWVHIPTAIVFGIPSITAIFLTREYILPAVPEHIFTAGHYTLRKNMLLMLLFALLMMTASYSMIKQNSSVSSKALQKKRSDAIQIILRGTFIGLVTGLVGAGGGFLIIPALVNMLKLPIKTAVGTSLLIIAVNSLLGFMFSLPHLSVQWDFLLSIAAIAIIGILIGTYLATKINGGKLKPAFGWFVLAMGVYIILKETLAK